MPRNLRVLTTPELLQKMELERDAWRKRAEKAEAELAEWKQRFDKLLARTPEVTHAAPINPQITVYGPDAAAQAPRGST